ncbi:hypothetical protein FN976_07735 [Caenimonas sedimenti]|uniref:DUF2783 domain-containing protein n=1 Tax=Caenimonas sedimenti TaxID=2596921 RepID=A0A562ZU96_9BURK|nr:hypothetical protein [Caenimonas sedimenti]TWO71875.1 hypothetical protein FN976_07735 [Caenimonas sedimenti]
MTDADLDRSYTALCQALAQAGPERSQLLLAMLSLQLMARAESADTVLPLIAQAAARCGEGGV